MIQYEEKIAQLQESLKTDMANIEDKVTNKYTLADAIREGSAITTQAYGWGDGKESACALSAAAIAARARGVI